MLPMISPSYWVEFINILSHAADAIQQREKRLGKVQGNERSPDETVLEVFVFSFLTSDQIP